MYNLFITYMAFVYPYILADWITVVTNLTYIYRIKALTCPWVGVVRAILVCSYRRDDTFQFENVKS